MERMNPNYRNLKPTFQDWLLVVIGLAFVVMGIVVLPRNPSVGIVTITFFGLCAGIGIRIVIGKRKDSGFQSLSVQVIGGIDIRPSRRRIFVMACLLVFVGSVLIVFGGQYSIVFQALAGVIAGFGIVLVTLIALRKIPVGFIRFDYEGFTIGKKRWNVILPWDEILEVQAGDYSGNSALFLWIKSFDRIKTVPNEFRKSAVDEMRANEKWIGSHFIIVTENYNLSAPMVAEALERYILTPAAREELKERVSLV